MVRRRTIARVLIAACAIVVAGSPALPRITRAIGAPVAGDTGTTTLAGETPTIVATGQATVLGPHIASAPLSINVSLPLRNQAALNHFIANDADRGIYLTQAQFDATYGPTAAQAQAVRQWGTAHGLQTTFTSDDNTLITLRGSTAAVETALGVAINDYRRSDGAVFYSNNTDATVPSSLGIQAISGLNSIPRWHVLQQVAMRARFRSGGYFPSDFRTAYDMAGHGYDGTGQTLGFTLWGASVPNSDLAAFAANTGDVVMSAGTGADQIQWIPVNGGSSATDALGETALDVETAHGIATHAHLKYWLGDETCSGGLCGGSDVGLEDAVAAAAGDSSLHVVSNSWGGDEAPSTSDPFVSATTSSFQHAVAVGTTFYFASGDSGADSGGSSLPSYPADSPYVVSVGGTTLTTTASSAYSSESAWSGSGGGCSAIFARPSWQTGVGAATCSGRAVPDVAADADPNSGAYVYVQGSGQQIGGTSLATPLLAGMAAVADRYAALNSLTRIGWAAPKIYSLANGSSYRTSFHDVTSGNNGYAAGTGWDEATGWGSIDWWNWVRAIAGTPGNPTATPTHTPLPTATRTAVPSATHTAIPSPTRTTVPSVTRTPVPSATRTSIPNATATRTPPPTATRTPTPSATSIPAGGSSGISNGGFESGSLAGWTAAVRQDLGNVEVVPRIAAAQHHSGAYSALVGSANIIESSGDSCLYQNFTTSGGTLSLYYLPFDPDGDNIDYDWQEAYIRPAGTSGCGESGTPLFRVESNSGFWTRASITLAAGSYQLYLNVHEDGSFDPSYMYVDDVAAPGLSGPTPTATRTPLPGATATRTPLPTATRTPVPGACSSSAVVNGGFETGTLSGWCSAGVGQGGQPAASTDVANSGAYSARLGVSSGSTEPNGDNCLYQNINISGSHTLTFYDLEVDLSGDTIDHDWQEAYWRPYGTTGCSEVGTQLYKIEGDYEFWYPESFTVSGPGQIYFNVHEDGSNSPSAMYVDDVQVR